MSYIEQNKFDFDVIKIVRRKQHVTQKDFFTKEPVPYYIGN